MKTNIFVLFATILLGISQAFAEDITSLEQLDATQSYYVRQGSKGYLYANNGQACTDGRTTATDDEAHRWAVAYNEQLNAYFLYNLKDSTFLTTADGVCPLVETASPVYLFETMEGASWYAYTAGGVVGLAQNTTSGDILLQGENSAKPDALTFEPAGALNEKHQSKVRQATWLIVTQQTDVPIISAIGTRISSLSDIQDGGAYLLYSTGFSKYAYDAGNALSFGSSAPSKNNLTAMPYVFIFHKSGDAYTIETGIDGNYISALSGSTVATGTEPTTFTISASSTAGSFNIYNAASSQYINAQSAKPVGWGSSEGNSRYQLIPVTLTSSDKYFPVTYLCYETDGEHTRLMDVQTYAKSTNRLTPPTFTGYKRLSTKAADGESAAPSIATEPTVVCVTYERNLRSQPVIPTTISHGIFADTTTWYTLTVSDRYMQYSADAPGHYFLNNTELSQITDADLWCFVGDNVNGYRLFNREAGTALSLTLKDEPQSTDLPFLTEGAFPYWAITNGGTNGTWYLTPVGTKKTVYLSDDGQHKLSVMGSSAAIVIEEAAATMQGFASEAAANLGTNVGQYPAASANALVSAADAYAKTRQTFNTLQRAYNTFRTSASRIALDNNRLYRIAKADGTTVSAAIGAEAASTTAEATDDRSQLWRVLPIGSTGSYYLLNPESGRFLGITSTTRPGTMVDEPTTHSYSISNFGGNLSSWTLKDNGTSTNSFLNYSDGTLAGGKNTAESAAWHIVPVQQFVVETQGADGVCAATVCLPFDAAYPDDLTAAAITEKTAESVTVEPLTGGIIPAGTPVLLVSATPRTYTLTATASKAEAPAQNLLVGVGKRLSLGAEGAPAEGQAYVLGSNARFVTATDALPAYSAYLSREEAAAAALALLLPTAIQTITTTGTAQRDEWYDLQGRRTSTPTRPGIFIHGGKKIIVQ
ncbi:MAG: hypothetical protein IKI05_00550 [Bacteroidaceae bacterium]|nr:hypothetical protein [Bacteroidaceae bacterium]